MSTRRTDADWWLVRPVEQTDAGDYDALLQFRDGSQLRIIVQADQAGRLDQVLADAARARLAGDHRYRPGSKRS